MSTIGANKCDSSAEFDINLYESETKATGRIVLKDGYYQEGVAFTFVLNMRMKLSKLEAVDVVYYNVRHNAGFFLKHVRN